MHKTYVSSLLLFLLSGCTALVNTPVASRTTHPEAFKIIKSGRVDSSKVQSISDCIHDGFAGSHGVLTNFTFRMNRRAGGYRIETTVGGTLVLMSADVMDDGVVELRESNAAGMINTTGEKEAFDFCTSKFLMTGS